MDIVFCDLETTGLDPARHTICEIGLIRGIEVMDKLLELDRDEWARAESMALIINKYVRRINTTPNHIVPCSDVLDLEKTGYTNPRDELALDIVSMTDGCILAGNNVKFDQQFLEAWLRRHGACPTWDYHVLDVPTFAAGVLYSLGAYMEPPYKSSKISAALDIPEPEASHTALGDARWAKQVYEAALEKAND